MVQTHDILLNGAGYMLVPGSYKYKALGAEVVPVRAGVSDFATRLGAAQTGPLIVDKDSARWFAYQMMPLPVGLGVAPGRMVLAPAEVQAALGLANFSVFDHAVIYAGAVYFSIGANLYRINTTSGAFSSVTFIGTAAGAITSFAVIYNILFMACAAPATTMSNYAAGAMTNSPAVKAAIIWQYAQGIWRSKGDDPTTISGSIDGGTTWTQWQLDAVVKSVTPWHGRSTGGGVILVATQYMLWELSGQWTGSPAVFTGTVSPIYNATGGGAADDFGYMVEYQGFVYTQYAGTVHRWNGVSLLPLPGGPRGQMWGMCVAGDCLCVSMFDAVVSVWSVWCFDGARWFELSRSAGVGYNNLAGTGGLITDGHLLSLDWSGSALSRWEMPVLGYSAHPRASGTVMVGPLDAGQGDAVKVWTQILVDWSVGLYESLASSPANPGGSLQTEYSIDDGVSYTVVGTTTIAAAATSGHQVHPIGTTGVEAARLLVRVTWTPTSAYAGLTIDGVWASGWRVADKPHLEQWTMDLHISDRMITRAGSVDARSGETQIAALRALAQSGAPVTFQDIDFDLSARSVTARVIGFEESSRKGDGTHFLESSVRLTVAAVA